MIELEPEIPGRTPPATADRMDEIISELQRLRASFAALSTQVASLRLPVDGISPAQPNSQLPISYPSSISAPAAPSNAPALISVAPDREAAAQVRINMLGPFRLEIAGQGHGPGVPGQVRTILEFLVSQGRRPTSRDALLDLLWPDADPDVASSRLRVVMHTLRKTIHGGEAGVGEVVITSGNNYLINPRTLLWVDVEEFEKHWLAGWRLARAGKTTDALAEYEKAEALYQGDYLEDEPYADWTLLRREALRDAYASILAMLAGMSLKAGDSVGCIIWAQKLLAQDNCREDAYRLLMVSHARLGQPSRAAYWYNLCSWSLRRELGIEPSTETKELFEGLNSQL